MGFEVEVRGGGAADDGEGGGVGELDHRRDPESEFEYRLVALAGGREANSGEILPAATIVDESISGLVTGGRETISGAVPVVVIDSAAGVRARWGVRHRQRRWDTPHRFRIGGLVLLG